MQSSWLLTQEFYFEVAQIVGRSSLSLTFGNICMLKREKNSKVLDYPKACPWTIRVLANFRRISLEENELLAFMTDYKLVTEKRTPNSVI